MLTSASICFVLISLMNSSERFHFDNQNKVPSHEEIEDLKDFLFVVASLFFRVEFSVQHCPVRSQLSSRLLIIYSDFHFPRNV